MWNTINTYLYENGKLNTSEQSLMILIKNVINGLFDVQKNKTLRYFNEISLDIVSKIKNVLFWLVISCSF